MSQKQLRLFGDPPLEVPAVDPFKIVVEFSHLMDRPIYIADLKKGSGKWIYAMSQDEWFEAKGNVMGVSGRFKYKGSEGMDAALKCSIGERFAEGAVVMALMNNQAIGIIDYGSGWLECYGFGLTYEGPVQTILKQDGKFILKKENK